MRGTVRIEWISGASVLTRLGGCHIQQKVDDAGGQSFIAEEARKRDEENEKGKHREQRAEGDVAGKRDGLVGEQAADSSQAICGSDALSGSSRMAQH